MSKALKEISEENFSEWCEEIAVSHKEIGNFPSLYLWCNSTHWTIPVLYMCWIILLYFRALIFWTLLNSKMLLTVTSYSKDCYCALNLIAKIVIVRFILYVWHTALIHLMPACWINEWMSQVLLSQHTCFY